jgi:Ssp1 endopeptidase immunity protein Rap1a
MCRLALVMLLAVGIWPVLSHAAARDHFLARNTQDYVQICATPQSDPLYPAAMGFCHGYAVGAYHYYLASGAGTRQKGFVCLPNPAPSREEGLRMFLAWAQENPQYMGASAVDSLFRFMAATWPCPQ